MDRATRYGSYVPVTTIGIAPIRTRANGRQSADSPENAADNVWGVNKGRCWPTFPDDWFAKIKMLLWRSVDKMDGE